MKLPQTCTLAALAALLSACTINEGVQLVVQDPFGEEVGAQPTESEQDAAGGWSGWGDTSGATLYAHDGSPVGTGGAWDGAPQGSSIGAPDRGLSEDPGSRFLLLDRYQEVLDDRDHLEVELAGVQAELDQAWARIDQLEQRLSTLDTDFSTRGEELAQARSRITDLADRLVTAEIHRLEAERRWYEAEISARGVTPLTQAPAAGTGK